MLSFLSPLFLVGAAAAAIPLVLHLLRRQPELRVKFAAVKLLQLAPVEHTEKRHLRELLLLMLRIAALVLLALAFARPFLPSGATLGSVGATIVALDTSYSMSAPGRFERARRLARDAIARSPAGSWVGVLTFADQAELVVKPTADRAMAESAIDRAAPTFGTTRYRAALAAAAQALAGRPGLVVVVTDLQEIGFDDAAALDQSSRLQVVDVGELPPNLAVTAVGLSGDAVRASVRNTAPEAREARLSLSIDDRPAGEKTVSIDPNQTVDVTFSPVARGTTVRVAVDDRDGLQADNARFAAGGPSRPSVLVVTATGDLGREAFYVQQALMAGAPDGKAYEVAALSAGGLSSWSDDRMRAHAAVFLLATRGLDRRGRELLSAYLRSGGGIVIAAGQDIDADIVADVLGSETTLRVAAIDTRPDGEALAPADVRHPLFLRFGDGAAPLGLVKFRAVRRIGGSGCEIVARFTTGDSALLDCTAGDGRGLVIASDLDNKGNDFPLHETFVPFVHEAVRYLASPRPQAGEYLIANVPAGVARTPGVVTLPAGQDAASQTSLQIAVNVDPREADPARISAEEFQAAVTRLSAGTHDLGVSEAPIEARQEEERQHLWQYLLAAMIAVLALEGLVASRTA